MLIQHVVGLARDGRIRAPSEAGRWDVRRGAIEHGRHRCVARYSRKMPSRETVFDETLMPLLSQIYDICEQRGIPFVATFELDPAETGVVVMGTSMFLPADMHSADLREFGERMDPDEPTMAEGAIAPVIPIRRER